MLEIEEEYVRRVCQDIIMFKPDLVFTEKGVSGVLLWCLLPFNPLLLDLAQHFLVKAGITAIRRVRKSDNNRIARACGTYSLSTVM